MMFFHCDSDPTPMLIAAHHSSRHRCDRVLSRRRHHSSQKTNVANKNKNKNKFLNALHWSRKRVNFCLSFCGGGQRFAKCCVQHGCEALLRVWTVHCVWSPYSCEAGRYTGEFTLSRRYQIRGHHVGVIEVPN